MLSLNDNQGKCHKRARLQNLLWLYCGDATSYQPIMIGSASFLYSIEKDGSLYMISPINGSWKQIGQKGAWVNTIKGTILGDRLLTVESNGALFETRLSTGVWQQLGKNDFANTKFLCSGLGKIYSIEASGTLYEINVR